MILLDFWIVNLELSSVDSWDSQSRIASYDLRNIGSW